MEISCEISIAGKEKWNYDQIKTLVVLSIN